MHRYKVFRRKIVEWMSHRVYLVYLSAYSPELNLIETLWRQMKYAWLSLSVYPSFDRLCNETMPIAYLVATEQITRLTLNSHLEWFFMRFP